MPVLGEGILRAGAFNVVGLICYILKVDAFNVVEPVCYILRVGAFNVAGWSVFQLGNWKGKLWEWEILHVCFLFGFRWGAMRQRRIWERGWHLLLTPLTDWFPLVVNLQSTSFIIIRVSMWGESSNWRWSFLSLLFFGSWLRGGDELEERLMFSLKVQQLFHQSGSSQNTPDCWIARVQQV